MDRTLVTAAAVRTGGAQSGDALVIEGDRIVAVGPASELRAEGLQVVDLGRATIVPGLRDAHLHPIGYAASLARPSLKAAADFEDLRDILSAAAHRAAPGTAVAAMRLDDETLAEGRLPDRHLLDRAAPDRPVIAVRYCGHITVANTRALELAGISRDTPDPEGGIIDRDELGIPTGVLRETAAEMVSTAVRGLAPPVTTEELIAAIAGLPGLGLTGIGAVVTTDQGCWAGAGSELEALIAAGPHLPIDVAVLVAARTPHELEAAAGRLAAAGPRVSFLGLKVFGDGSLGGHTAAMHEPFTDRPDLRGTLRIGDWVRPTAQAAIALGGQVAVHAIGDRANTEVLDLMEELVAGGADPPDLRIEHASVLTEADIARLASSGFTAVVQPAFLVSETEWLEARVGAERLRRTYPFRRLLTAGARLAGSSDSPVEPPHPLWGMAAAVDRGGLVPRESLTSAEALDLFTAGAARAIRQESLLEEGATATFTVLDGDPVEESAAAIRRLDVMATWVDGTPLPARPGHVPWVA